jgi:hypothetical protein
MMISGNRGGHLRHAKFFGLRDDKPAKQVHRESPARLEGFKKQSRKIFIDHSM